MIQIKNSGKQDIKEIFRLCKISTDFQKTRFTVHWPIFDRGPVENEIDENRQWKIKMDGKTVCILLS
ncbi:hypothetical protein [Sphingobacterium tabacisoli]|uniref:N-acetyltransferase n=1 Tax=Sphingobacterium tabacisoli TaxID=2044855 RepID=A0ABW5L7Q1_9SPHI|nr:hypothetical protein [Sphingobacterium tabacisoli]